MKSNKGVERHDMGGYYKDILYEITFVKKEMRKGKNKRKMNTRYYWILERNVKRILEN